MSKFFKPSLQKRFEPSLTIIFTVFLTLCRSYLKPFCMGRKTVFFQWAFNLHTKTRSALERLGHHGTFKSRALWSVRDGKGLILKTLIIDEDEHQKIRPKLICK
jgi:hypothetical protein